MGNVSGPAEGEGGYELGREGLISYPDRLLGTRCAARRWFSETLVGQRDMTKFATNPEYSAWQEALSYEQFVEHTYKRFSAETSAKVSRNRKYLGKTSGHRHQIDVSVEMQILLVSCGG